MINSQLNHHQPTIDAQKEKNKFFWGVEFTPRTFAFYHRRRRQTQILEISAIFIAIIGLLSLAVYCVQQYNAYFVWQSDSVFLFVFFLSFWADLFLLAKTIKTALTANVVAPLIARSHQTSEAIDIAPAFPEEFFSALEQAYIEASQNPAASQQISDMLLLFHLCDQPQFLNFANRINVQPSKLQEKIRRQLTLINQEKNSSTTPAAATFTLDDNLKQALVEAFLFSANLGDATVRLETVVGALYKYSPLIQEIFFALDTDKQEIGGCLDWLRINRLLLEQQQNYHQSARFKITGDMNASYTATATPILNKFSYDLTIAAKKENLPLCVARDQEIAHILDVFASNQNGLVLVGPAAIGKKTLVYGIAQLMVEEKVPPQLQDKRLVALDTTKLLGGIDQVSAQERLIYILNEVISAGNVILFIEDINNILSHTQKVGTNPKAGFDFAKILAEALNKKQVLLISTCQEKVYEEYVEKQPLGQAMMKIRLEEPTVEQTITILQTKTFALERENQIRFTYDCLSEAANLSQRYLTEKQQPQKSIEIIELAATKAVARCQLAPAEVCLCSRNEAAAVVSDMTHIPLQEVTQSESDKLLNLEKMLHQRVIGQDEAVDAVGKALRRARTDLQQNRNQPLASFLFLGPTGVGKTELSKAIAAVYFGRSNDMIRLDMSEYQQINDIKKLIGDPEGNNLGYLTEAVRKSPYSLILFDEIEKAHPNVLNLFLQVLDDGRLTNGQGQTVNFANTIIVATSNAAAQFINQSVSEKKPVAEIRAQLLNEKLFAYFRPEFINRFDETIMFTPLTLKEMEAIASLALTKIKDNLQEKGIELVTEKQALTKIARDSYSPQYGARPMRRYLKDNLESQVATLILAQAVSRRDKIILHNDLSLSVEKAPEI